jgi:zinc/manganese transport system substrate-binding protein
MRRLLPALLLLLVSAVPSAGAEVNAVASFSILGDMVRQVGGERVAVTTIVGPNADTHVYEPKPADAAAVADADVFFVNGLGFEGWMDRFVQATGYAGPLVVASAGVATHTMNEDGATVTDPHAWQSLGNGMAYVETIAGALCRVDAAGCATYKANAVAYEARLTALDAQVRAAIAAVPPDRRKVITTHDAFGYFGRDYGVAFLAPEGISTDAEPSAMDVARLIVQIRNEGVSALFIENMSDGRLIEQIAAETGVELGGELYADALSGPDGPAASYADMFRHNAELLVKAMRGQ